MYPHNLYFTRRTILSSLILQSIFHITLSYDKSFWCGKVQEEVMDVWSGQNISMRFYLKDPLLQVQTLMWRKGESIWVKPHDQPLEYNGYGDYEVGRYRLTAVSNIIFNLFIGNTEQNDSGHHVVTVNQGGQPLCLALLLNLTIATPEPICSTHLNNESKKLQMSCEWLQMNKGDRAHFEADNEIMYEHQIPEMNFNGSFNMTHQFSVYVGLDKILDEFRVPNKCIVTHRKDKAREVCEFPVVTPHPIENTQHRGNVDFECCVSKPSKPILLVYDGDGNGLSVDSKLNYNASNAGDAGCILFFLCGSNGALSEITILNMKSLDVRKHAIYESSTQSLHVADPKRLYNNSREDEQCKVITVNFTRLDSTLNNQEGISTECVVNQTCVHTNATGVVPSSYPCCPCKVDGITAENQAILIAVATIAALALGCITGACITKCYSRYSIPRKDQYLVRRDMGNGLQRSSTPTDDDNAGALAMTFIAQTPQRNADPGSPGGVLNQRSTDAEEPFLREGSVGPLPAPLVGPLNMPSQGEMVKHDSDGPSDRKAHMASARTTWPDSTYCSMDDIEGIPSSAHSHGSGQVKTLADDLMATSSLIPDFVALYAKPDMSRKTKNMASAASDYDGPRVSLDDHFQSILVPEDSLHAPAPSTDQNYHVYDNSLASPTDESTSGGELYMNTL